MVSGENVLLVEPVSAADGPIFEAYQALGSGGTETYSRLLPDKSKLRVEKERFIASGYQTTPDLRPENLDAEALEVETAQLGAFKGQIGDLATNPDVAQAYRWSINERIGNTRMLQAIAADDPRRFDAYNNFIYGTPDSAVFGGAVDWLCSYAEQASDGNNRSVAEAADVVLGLFGDKRGDRGLVIPSDEVFQAVREEHFKQDGFYALLLAGVELSPGERVTPTNGEPALRTVLTNLKSDYKLADSAGASWSMSQSTREARRPKRYDLDYARFIGMTGHEIGSHHLESVNGSRSALGLAGSGLDRADAGNEGRALIREQVVYKTFDDFTKTQRWQIVLRRQIATALQLGIAGKTMDFGTTFRHINAVDVLYERAHNPDNPQAADTKAVSRTWSLLQEINKGTDGRSGPYRRYPLYLDGNVACWQLASRHPERIGQGDLGKFDITNPRHTAILEQYHVIPPLSKLPDADIDTYNDGIHYE